MSGFNSVMKRSFFDAEHLEAGAELYGALRGAKLKATPEVWLSDDYTCGLQYSVRDADVWDVISALASIGYRGVPGGETGEHMMHKRRAGRGLPKDKTHFIVVYDHFKGGVLLYVSAANGEI
jgi:hypothetical protein